MKLENELDEAGYTGTNGAFIEILADVFANMYPGWTDEDLVCHPQEAADFCDAVMGKAKVKIPDHVILKALLNARKASCRLNSTRKEEAMVQKFLGLAPNRKDNDVIPQPPPRPDPPQR